MRTPTELEWETAKGGDLDEKYAYKTFAGKSIKEARKMFRENVLSRAEDLWYMPAAPFRYYMLAFREYVLSDAVFEDECAAADAANAFLGLVERKVQQAQNDISPILAELLPAADFIARHQAKYSAPLEIYGDFQQQYERIRMLLKGA